MRPAAAQFSLTGRCPCLVEIPDEASRKCRPCAVHHSTCFWQEKGQSSGRSRRGGEALVLKGSLSVLPHFSWDHRISPSLIHPPHLTSSLGSPGCKILHRLHSGESFPCPNAGLGTRLRWCGLEVGSLCISGPVSGGPWQDTGRAPPGPHSHRGHHCPSLRSTHQERTEGPLWKGLFSVWL